MIKALSTMYNQIVIYGNLSEAIQLVSLIDRHNIETVDIKKHKTVSGEFKATVVCKLNKAK